MTEKLLSLVEQWGIWGVYLSLFIEGSAFPFVGTFFLITVGFLLELTWIDIGFISIIGSLLYAMGSYIPYFIGLKFGSTIENRLKEDKRKKFEKMKKGFSKYGVWSVAISSPLHLGNVVPFVAGVSKMSLSTYTLLTMVGIAPTTFLFLSLGYFHSGEPDEVIAMINSYFEYALLGFIGITIGYIYLKSQRHSQKRREYSGN